MGKQWRCGKSRNSRETALGDHTILNVSDDKMINYHCIKLEFSQLIKHLLFYIPYKICKHIVKSIDFTASVYELFDNPSYMYDKNLKTTKYWRKSKIFWVTLSQASRNSWRFIINIGHFTHIHFTRWSRQNISF